MYRHCLFCSADLGANEAVEEFPVGATLAFDAGRGRLWAVCRGCGRWNLAPIEERWEAVERLEETFAGARMRAQSENVGLARLPDGTRVVRIGRALPRELAAWRYGPQLLRRHRASVAATAGAVAVGGLLYMASALLVTAVGSGAILVGLEVRESLRRRKVVHWLDAAASPTGAPWPLRRADLGGARMRLEGDALALELPQAPFSGVSPRDPLVLTGAAARAVLSRAMTAVNGSGAKQEGIDAALDGLERFGVEDYVRRAALGERALGLPLTAKGAYWFATTRGLARQAGYHLWRDLSGRSRRMVGVDPDAPPDPFGPPPDRSLRAPEALALEMALHEEQERRALEGELALLEAAWREAEEIAAIADRLAAPALPAEA